MLSALEVRQAKSKQKPYKLTDSHGLYLHVMPNATKAWRYRYRFAGKESTYTLGTYPDISLEQARSNRGNARAMLKEGKNPTLERKQDKQARLKAVEVATEGHNKSFENIALEWIEQQSERWSKGHAQAVLATIRTDAFPVLGELPVDSITPPQILEVIRGIEKRGSLEIASKVLQRMTAVFRYAVQTGKATYNPASEMRGVLKTRKVQHRTALTASDLPVFLQKLSNDKDLHLTTKFSLQFVILTAAKSGEVRGATWDEIDLDNNLWRVPAERMKMDTTHTVPLSSQAVVILERVGKLYGKDGLVFPGIKGSGKQLSENTLLYALYRLGYHSRATVHGFRATFSTIANENGFDGDVIEKALAHEERNRVRAAYHRSEYLEQRKKLMQWWADYLDALERDGKVVPIFKTPEGG